MCILLKQQLYYVMATPASQNSSRDKDGRLKMCVGLEILTAMERIPTDDDDRPMQEIKFTSATVFVNPFKEMEEAEKKQAEEEKLKVEYSKHVLHDPNFLKAVALRAFREDLVHQHERISNHNFDVYEP